MKYRLSPPLVTMQLHSVYSPELVHCQMYCQSVLPNRIRYHKPCILLRTENSVTNKSIKSGLITLIAFYQLTVDVWSQRGGISEDRGCQKINFKCPHLERDL